MSDIGNRVMTQTRFTRGHAQRVLGLLLLFMGFNCAAMGQTVSVYAAASLQNSLSKIIKVYQKQNPNTKIIMNFAGSGTLAKQIKAGAAADIFISADQAWMAYLIQHQQVDAKQVQNWLGNRLVLIAPRSSAQKIVLRPKPSLAAQSQGFICVGQIQSVPAGRYAWQSFQYYQWTSDLTGRLVETDDVRATLNFVARQECALGVVYATDAKNQSAVKVLAQFPAASHGNIVYPMALTLTGQNKTSASNFYQFLQSSTAKKVLLADGFIWLQR